MPGLYSFDSPRKLYDKLERDYVAFYKNPSEDGLFAILFPLYHLREWICPGTRQYDRTSEKPEAERTPAERLLLCLHQMDDYKTVGALCIHAKAFRVC